MNGDIKHLNTDFGMIAVPPDAEQYITPATEREINRTAESIFCVGGNLGGEMALKRVPDYADDGRTLIGSRVYVVLNFTGEAMVEVARERLT